MRVVIHEPFLRDIVYVGGSWISLKGGEGIKRDGEKKEKMGEERKKVWGRFGGSGDYM